MAHKSQSLHVRVVLQECKQKETLHTIHLHLLAKIQYRTLNNGNPELPRYRNCSKVNLNYSLNLEHKKELSYLLESSLAKLMQDSILGLVLIV